MTTPSQDLSGDLTVLLASTHFGNRFEEDEKRSVRDPHTGRIIRSSDYGSDEFVNVAFTTEQVLSKAETYRNGGKPSYVTMDFITISTPGDARTVVHRPVTDFDQWRFPFEYEAFKAGSALAVRGTPLADWPALEATIIKEMEHHGIKTIEQLANLNESRTQVRQFIAWKAKAQTFLSSKPTAEAKALEAKLAERDEQMAAMQAKLDALIAMMGEKKPKA